MSANENKEDIEFFNGVKSALLELCENNSNISEFQKLKENLIKSYSFDELLNPINNKE